MPALFEYRNGLFVPGELTRGGWADDTQHGGPPAGILARAIERVPTVVPMLVTRFTIDLIRPVPLTPLRIETGVIREGKRVQLVEASLWASDIQVARAVALRIRVGDVDLPDSGSDRMPAPPEGLEPLVWQGHFGEDPDLERFHYNAVEIRSLGGSFLTSGEGTSWFRLLCQVVAGETPSPFVLLATLSDLANGNAQALDPTVHAFINPDISLHVHRLPIGEWIGMRSSSYPHPTGIGMTDTAVYDLEGRIGRIVQSQFIEGR